MKKQHDLLDPCVAKKKKTIAKTKAVLLPFVVSTVDNDNCVWCSV